MTKAQLAALLLAAAAGGGAVSLSTAALIREAPGAKTYYTRSLRFTQTPGNPDGGNIIAATTLTTVTLSLSDGGSSVVDLGDVDCGLSAGQETQAQNLLTASANCAKTAP